MKTAVTFLLLIFSLSSFQLDAQNCKYKIDKTDPMSNERVRRITHSLKNYFKLSFYRKADDLRVEVNIRYNGEQNFKVPKGEEIYLKLDNDSILSLSAAEEANPVSYASGSQIMTNFAISYYISKEEMQQVGENGITVVRAELGGTEFTIEASKRETRKTATGAQCILTD